MDKYRKKINRKVYILSFLVVLLLLGSAATFALMSGKSNFLTNIFSAADHDTSITENVDGLNKDVFVENNSNNPAFVRVRVLVSPEGAVTLKFRNGETENDENCSSDWAYNESDGYYYYLKAVPSKQSTSQLLDSVEINTDFEDSTFDVTVYEESCIATVDGDGIQTLDTIKNAFNNATTISTSSE